MYTGECHKCGEHVLVTDAFTCSTCGTFIVPCEDCLNRSKCDCSGCKNGSKFIEKDESND